MSDQVGARPSDQALASQAQGLGPSGFDPSRGLSCDVCGRPAAGVASSGYGPISHSYCGECATIGAEPLMGFEYLFDFVSTDGEGLDPSIQSWVTWKDGRYIGWPEYVAERLVGPICEVHRVHALPSGCSICSYEASCADLPDGDGEELFDDDWTAIAMEAGTAETGTGSVHDSAAIAQNGDRP